MVTLMLPDLKLYHAVFRAVKTKTNEQENLLESGRVRTRTVC